jgi:hypothetical protein
MRRLPNDETRGLVTKLRRAGVTQAWTGSFDGVFHKDLAAQTPAWPRNAASTQVSTS